MVLLAVGTMGIHIELGRIFGMLGMTPTLTFGIASALATGVLSLGITLLDPLLRWVVAFVLPAFIVLLFYCAKGRVFPDQKVLYRESANDLFIPYRFMATSVTQGLAPVSYTHLASTALETPNVCNFGFTGFACYLPRMIGASAKMGEMTIADVSETHEMRYADPSFRRPDVIMVWGNEPLKANADGFLGHWIVAVSYTHLI